MRVAIWLVALVAQFFIFLSEACADPSNTLVVTKQGAVYFGDVLHNTVWKIADGKLTPFIKDKHSHRVVLDEQGNLYGEHLEYVPGNDSWRFHMWKATPAGEVSYVVPPSPGFPLGLLMDKDGNRYEWHGNSNKKDDSRIVKRLSDGTLRPLAGKGWGWADGKGEQAKFGQIGGMTWGQDGALYITDSDAIRKVALDGTVTTIVRGVSELQMGWKARALSMVALGKGGGHLYGLTLDTDGNIYAANLSTKAVVKFAPDGKVLNVIKSESGWAPSGVAVAGRDLYVLEFYDQGNAKGPRVRKIAADGSAVTLGTVGESTAQTTSTAEPPATPPSSVLKWSLALLVLVAIVISGWRVGRLLRSAR